jgi:GNAT superfamily N-acetyltransferase
VGARKKSSESSLRAPEPISATHDLSDFRSGESALDDWLRRRAMRNEASGGSRTYVVCEKSGDRVVACYCLAAGAVAHAVAPGKVRRNMPEPVPVLVIGRLAVDRRYQGHGLGRALLRDAIFRAIQAAGIAGIRAILVHAISDSARQFYVRAGFQPSPVDPMTLMITIAEADKATGQTRT